jgi:hypothetical protein
MSAGYLDELKIITRSKFGCIYKIFDLKHDPFEDHNLASTGGHCKIKFSSNNDDFGSIISTEIGRGHCSHKHNNNNENDNNMIEKDILFCMENYRHKIISKMILIMNKLVPFALNGNIAHTNYMTKDRNLNTCETPTTSQVAKLDFEGIMSNNANSKSTIPSY